MKRDHLQVMLWKAADRQGPPILDITNFGWDMKSGLPSPSDDTGPAAPDGLISGGSWGLGALGPAILWGPMQECDPTFPSWGLGRRKPPSGVRGRAPEAKHFGNNILKIG